MTGLGTQASPYMLYNQADLLAIPNNTVAYFKLGDNITVDSSFTGIPNGFGGSFDGDGYRIDGLKVPLFISITPRTTSPSHVVIVQNLAIDVNIVKNTGSGMTIFGALCPTITSYNGYVALKKIHATGTINITTTYSYPRVGQLIGDYSSGTSGYYVYTQDCELNVNITLTNNSASGWSCIGGICGMVDGSVVNMTSYSTIVLGSKTHNSARTLKTDAIAPQFNGSGTRTSNSSWPTYYLSTQWTSSTTSVNGKTATQLQTQATYTGFDFSTIWQIAAGTNNGYPTLRIIRPPGTKVTYIVKSNVAIINSRGINKGVITVRKSWAEAINSSVTIYTSHGDTRTVTSSVQEITATVLCARTKFLTVKSTVSPINAKTHVVTIKGLVVTANSYMDNWDKGILVPIAPEPVYPLSKTITSYADKGNKGILVLNKANNTPDTILNYSVTSYSDNWTKGILVDGFSTPTFVLKSYVGSITARAILTDIIQLKSTVGNINSKINVSRNANITLKSYVGEINARAGVCGVAEKRDVKSWVNEINSTVIVTITRNDVEVLKSYVEEITANVKVTITDTSIVSVKAWVEPINCKIKYHIPGIGTKVTTISTGDDSHIIVTPILDNVAIKVSAPKINVDTSTSKVYTNINRDKVYINIE